MRDFVKKHFPGFFGFLHKLKERRYERIGAKDPERLIRMWYKVLYGKPIDLKTPSDIDEKINWLKLHADTAMWTTCSDKLAVRDFVAGRGLGHTLNELYGSYDSAAAIDWDALPDSFVMKLTNGGGGNSVLIVEDKSALDLERTRIMLGSWLAERPTPRWGETHYAAIKPRLIAEKLLRDGSRGRSLVDYKFHCFNGEPYSVFVCSDRDLGQSVAYQDYDLGWHCRPENMVEKYRGAAPLPRPASLERMIDYSRNLAAGFEYVRVDWYEIDGEPVFGELTFTPAGGFQNFYTADYRAELGSRLMLKGLK